MNLLDRLANKVDVFAPNDCWEWTGYRNPKGYGKIKIAGAPRVAHRVLYEHVVDSVPDGLQLDHLCRNRACVNPDHLEPVTNRENFLRGDAPNAVTYRTGVCQRGHSMDDAMTNADGNRACRTCFNENRRRRYWESKT